MDNERECNNNKKKNKKMTRKDETYRDLVKIFKSWQDCDWLAKWIIMLWFMDLRWPRVCRRSNKVCLVNLCSRISHLTMFRETSSARNHGNKPWSHIRTLHRAIPYDCVDWSTGWSGVWNPDTNNLNHGLSCIVWVTTLEYSGCFTWNTCHVGYTCIKHRYWYIGQTTH